ncbi:MAG: hypothetical protein ACE5JM_12920 [Armatimonadota bacterium]
MSGLDDLLTLARLGQMIHANRGEFEALAGAAADDVLAGLHDAAQEIADADQVDDVQQVCARVMNGWGEDLTAKLTDWAAPDSAKRKPLMPGKSPRLDDSPKVRFICNRLIEITQEIKSEGTDDTDAEEPTNATART